MEDQRISNRIKRNPHVKVEPDNRVKEIIRMKPVCVFVKRILGLPVFCPVRYPLEGGKWHNRIERIL